MPRYIIKLSKDKTDYYLEWSTVVDAPVTYGMSLSEFTKYYRNEYGESSMRKEFKERMERVEDKGTSSLMHSNLKELISHNRAGDKEKSLSLKKIIEKYCIEKS